MAENSFPFYGEETSEAEYSDLFGLLSQNGVASGLGLSAGAGMNVTVAAGVALIRGRYYENTANKAVAVSAAPGSGTRKDAIILRLNIAAKTITAVSKDGTTAGGGTAPALQQDDDIWEVLLGYVTVASGTVSLTSGMIQQQRPTLGVPVFAYASNDDRINPAALPSALGVNTTTRVLSVWNGAAWGGLSVAYADITGAPVAAPVHDIDGDRHTGTLSIGKGGTGATTAAAARAALGVDEAGLAITEGRLPVVPLTKGGTGATTRDGARAALGIYVREEPLDETNAVGDIRLW